MRMAASSLQGLEKGVGRLDEGKDDEACLAIVVDVRVKSLCAK